MQFVTPIPGFYQRTDDAGWDPSFTSLPNLGLNDPSLGFVDLTGDGHADVILSEDEVYAWCPSLAENGFGPGEKVSHPSGKQRVLHLVFADGTQSVSLTGIDCTGVTDIIYLGREDCPCTSTSRATAGAMLTR